MYTIDNLTMLLDQLNISYYTVGNHEAHLPNGDVWEIQGGHFVSNHGDVAYTKEELTPYLANARNEHIENISKVVTNLLLNGYGDINLNSDGVMDANHIKTDLEIRTYISNGQLIIINQDDLNQEDSYPIDDELKRNIMKFTWRQKRA